MLAFCGPISNEVLESLTDADSLRNFSFRLCAFDVLIQLLSADVVELESRLHDLLRQFVVPVYQVFGLRKLFRVLDCFLKDLIGD